MSHCLENPITCESAGVHIPGSPSSSSETLRIVSKSRKRRAPHQPEPLSDQPLMGTPTEVTRRTTRSRGAPPCVPAQSQVWKTETRLAFEYQRLPVHSKTTRSQPQFLPALDHGMMVLLQDATRYCRAKKYKAMISCLHTALQLFSDGRVLEDMLSADPEDLSLVLSHIHSRLVKAFLRNKKAQGALEHAHRSVHLNPSHFQNHLRQAVVYRRLGQHWLAAKSALTADWLYCSLPVPIRRISSQLRLYWQAMLSEAQAVDSGVTVRYTPVRADASPEELQRAEQSLMEQDPSVAYVYTGTDDCFQILYCDDATLSDGDPRGVHVLPSTTDWLSAAPGDVQRYYITLGFKFKKDGLFTEKLCARLWPALAEARGDRTPGSGESQQKKLDTEELINMYEKILPTLDLMQATQLSSGLGPGSGLMERLQFSSLLDKLGLRREGAMTLLCCQAQLSTAPYLPPCPSVSSSRSQQDERLLQELQADLLDEMAGRGAGSERVWDKVLQVSWLEDLITSEEKSFNQKEAKRLQEISELKTELQST